MTDTTDFITLRNGRLVMPEFYRAIGIQLRDVIPELLEGRAYTARQLMGEAMWARLGTPGLRQQAGRCLAHLVAHRAVPLAFASPKGKWPRRYRLSTVTAARRRSQPYHGPVPEIVRRASCQ